MNALVELLAWLVVLAALGMLGGVMAGGRTPRPRVAASPRLPVSPTRPRPPGLDPSWTRYRAPAGPEFLLSHHPDRPMEALARVEGCSPECGTVHLLFCIYQWPEYRPQNPRILQSVN